MASNNYNLLDMDVCRFQMVPLSCVRSTGENLARLLGRRFRDALDDRARLGGLSHNCLGGSRSSWEMNSDGDRCRNILFQ